MKMVLSGKLANFELLSLPQIVSNVTLLLPLTILLPRLVVSSNLLRRIDFRGKVITFPPRLSVGVFIMSGLTSTTPSTSGLGGAIVQGVPQLPEAVVEVTNLAGYYEGLWSRVEEEVEGINRTDEDEEMATARVHVVVSDRSVEKIGPLAFWGCSNLVKVTAPFVEEVGERAFWGAVNLRHLSFRPDVVVPPGAFFRCLSLEVVVAAVGFKLDIGDRFRYGMGNWNDPTVAITRFAKWRNQMDGKKEYYKSVMVMLQLANTPLVGNVGMRATTEDPLWAFLAGPGRDIAKLVLSFKLGVKVGKGDLRDLRKTKLLEVGLELKVLRMEANGSNISHFGVIVDGEGMVIEGGIREAVRRGLVAKENYLYWWDLGKRGNGEVYDEYARYGVRGVVYGSMMDGVAVPL